MSDGMLAAGTRLGPYEIETLLGAGGMGEVYRARDSRLQRTVALKILPAQAASDPGRRPRFEQEARAASSLNHPNIVAVFDIGEQNGLNYIVSELIEGESLRDILRRGPLPLSRAIDLMSQTAGALAAAHAAGIVHRDLKPENIMTTREGAAKILDFGLAKQTAPASQAIGETPSATKTLPGTVMGTAAYMSPEQVRGDAVDHCTDIFSLGLVIYECVAGRHAFERATSVEIMTAILREDPAEMPENTPPALRQIVQHCLEKEPGQRFNSARDLAFALRTVSVGSRPSGASQQAAIAGSKRSGRKWLWPAIAGALALMLALVSFLSLRAEGPSDLAVYRLTPFARDYEPDSAAAWSPDGKSIAYLRAAGGIRQLMVRALGAAVADQLTHSDAPITQVFWSPDSSLLYYMKQSHDNELWAISPAGGKSSRILDSVIAAGISPDGKALAVWRGHADGARVRGELGIIPLTGGERRQYKPAPFQDAQVSPVDRVAFSPDGRSILLTTGSDASELWLLPYPESAAPRRVFRGTQLGVAAKASWFPDSRHVMLAFSPLLGAPGNLWIADLKGERMHKLTYGTVSHDDPSLSPDGRRAVFTTVEEDYTVIFLPLDGSAPRAPSPDSRNELSPSWSPAGDQMLYATDRRGRREIWIQNHQAGIDRPAVTPDDFPSGTTQALADPVFSPDGSRFAFVRYARGEPVNVWFERTAGGAPIRLTPEPMQSPAWSPDGNTLAGLVERENRWQPAMVGVGADMSPHMIVNGPKCVTPLDWAPAGDWLACETSSNLALFSSDGSQSRLLPPVNASGLVFSRDGKTLYAGGTEHGRSFLKAVDLASGAVRNIADLGSGMTISGGIPLHTRLSLGPQGKSVATSAVTLKSDLWLLEGYPMPKPWWRVWP